MAKIMAQKWNPDFIMSYIELSSSSAGSWLNIKMLSY